MTGQMPAMNHTFASVENRRQAKLIRQAGGESKAAAAPCEYKSIHTAQNFRQRGPMATGLFQFDRSRCDEDEETPSCSQNTALDGGKLDDLTMPR